MAVLNVLACKHFIMSALATSLCFFFIRPLPIYPSVSPPHLPLAAPAHSPSPSPFTIANYPTTDYQYYYYSCRCRCCYCYHHCLCISPPFLPTHSYRFVSLLGLIYEHQRHLHLRRPPDLDGEVITLFVLKVRRVYSGCVSKGTPVVAQPSGPPFSSLPLCGLDRLHRHRSPFSFQWSRLSALTLAHLAAAIPSSKIRLPSPPLLVLTSPFHSTGSLPYFT